MDRSPIIGPFILTSTNLVGIFVIINSQFDRSIGQRVKKVNAAMLSSEHEKTSVWGFSEIWMVLRIVKNGLTEDITPITIGHTPVH